MKLCNGWRRIRGRIVEWVLTEERPDYGDRFVLLTLIDADKQRFAFATKDEALRYLEQLS